MEYDGGVGAALGNLDMDTPAKPKRGKPPPGPPPRGQAKKYAAPLAPANGAGLQTPKFLFDVFLSLRGCPHAHRPPPPWCGPGGRPARDLRRALTYY